MRGQLGAALVALSILGLGAYAPEAGAQDKITNCGPITQPGSYVLGKNLNSIGDCLVVQADFVTIDLNGFTITGNGTGSGLTSGGTARRGIAIRNGTITGFDYGINFAEEGLPFPSGMSSTIAVERVRAIGNVTFGIFVGVGSRVVDSQAADTVHDGIVAREGSVLTGNAAYRNGDFGIICFACTVAGNSASFNRFIGISAGRGSTVTGNTVLNTGFPDGGGLAGMHVRCPSNVIGNTATNTNSGFGDNLVLDTSLGPCNSVDNVAP